MFHPPHIVRYPQGTIQSLRAKLFSMEGGLELLILVSPQAKTDRQLLSTAHRAAPG